jgi:uncharacterized protein (PEP-CTERM system associated)
MAMVTAMVMAMGVDRSDRGPRGLIRQPRKIVSWLETRSPSQVPWRHVLVGIGCVSAAAPVLADNWRITPTASLSETYTSNVNYSAAGSAESDFATSVTGTLQISGQGARARLNGSIGATGLFYVRETQNNSFVPSVNLVGSLEAIEKFFYIDAQVYVSQSFFSPFAAQPGNIVNATANRYTSETYSIGPYIQGLIGGTNITYLVRDDNIWSLSSQLGNTSVDAPNTYLNQLHATLNAPTIPWGWTLEYMGTRYEPANRDTLGSYTTRVGRAIFIYQFDPQVQVSARVGYENDDFPLQSSQGVVYGAGLQWSPSDRTQVSGFWEHRFFGSSYSGQIRHRLPRTALSATFSRGLNTYPQNALTIPAGANVPSFVDAAFTTRIPDPAERALAVQQFVAQAGLPPTLATPVNIFSAAILLQTSISASAVLIGLRNSLAFNVFYLKSDAISGTGSVLPPALQFGQNNTQTGGGVSFSHRLSGMTNLTASATYSRTTTNNSVGAFADTGSNNGYVGVGLSTQLGPKTTGSLGANYQRFVPTGNLDTRTTSAVNVVAGVNHVF